MLYRESTVLIPKLYGSLTSDKKNYKNRILCQNLNQIPDINTSNISNRILCQLPDVNTNGNFKQKFQIQLPKISKIKTTSKSAKQNPSGIHAALRSSARKGGTLASTKDATKRITCHREDALILRRERSSSAAWETHVVGQTWSIQILDRV
jgi:hypothetical protein